MRAVLVADVVIDFGVDVLLAAVAAVVRVRFTDERRRDCRNISGMGCMMRWKLSL